MEGSKDFCAGRSSRRTFAHRGQWVTAAWRARLPSRWALPTPQRGLKGGLIGVGPRLRFLYNGRTLRAISQFVLLLVALMVVLLMVAPHGAPPPDPPPYIGVFVPVPVSPPGTAGLRAISRHPVIADGYRYMPARIDSALARAVAENGHSLAGGSQGELGQDNVSRRSVSRYYAGSQESG